MKYLKLLFPLICLLFTMPVHSTSAKTPSSVPASFLWCVNSFAHKMPKKLNDYEGICAQRDSFLKCLVDKCEYGNYLSARDHFLGTCINMVPKLVNDKRYKFFRQFSKSHRDFWNEETRGRKEAIRGYYKLKDSVRYYSNSSNTDNDFQNGEPNVTSSLLTGNNWVAQAYGDSLLERRRFENRVPPYSPEDENDDEKENEEKENEEEENEEEENEQQKMKTADSMSGVKTYEPNKEIPVDTKKMFEQETGIKSEKNGDSIISFNFDDGENQQDENKAEFNGPDAKLKKDEEQKLEELFGTEPKAAPRKKIRRRKKGHAFKLRNKKKKIYKSQRERKYKMRDVEKNLGGPLAQAKRVLFG